MSNTTLAAKRTNDTPVAEGDHYQIESGIPASAGRWIAALLAVIVTLVLAYLLSPGLRTDVNSLLASDWVTGSTATWISVGVTILVILTLGFVYKDHLEHWMFRRTGGGQASVDSANATRIEDIRRASRSRPS